MSKMQRTKGAGGEREVVNILKEKGVYAQRISMLESGNVSKGDIKVGDLWIGEVKIGGQVPKFIYDALKTEACKMLFLRRDRMQWKICMDLDFFLETFLL